MSILDVLSGNNATDIHTVAPIPERLRKNERVVIVTADDTEDSEFLYPYYRLTEEGYQVDVVTPDGGALTAKHGIGISNTLSIDSVRPQDYVLMYIPGGKAPATLRKDERFVRFVQDFAATGRPIAAICHGPQLLVTAGLVKGIQMAAFPGIREELEEAGATFVDEALVEDGQFVTARLPGDLHRHLFGVLQYLRGDVQMQSRSQRRTAA